MIPLITIPGSQDPGSPPLHISMSCGAAALCVYQHAVGTAYAYAVLHVPCTGVTPDPMPHTFGPRCRSLGSLVWGNPGSMDPGILFRYHRGALVRGLRPLGLLLCLTSGPLVLRSNPRASSCSGSLWDHRPMALPFWDIPVMLRSSIRMYPRSSPRVISRCPDEDML